MDKKQYVNETSEHILKVGAYLCLFIKDLQERALNHDESKLSSPEKEEFIKYIPKLKNSTYGSTEYNEFLKGLNKTLTHHYKNNRHHPEYFKDGMKNMNLMDIIEMLCDWKATTLRHKDGNIERSIKMNQERFGYSDDVKRIFLNTVKLFWEK